MQEQVYVNREYKDSVFRMLYREKKNLLQLYNALNGTSHTDPEELIVTTLENAIYLGMKNDVSFLLDDRITLYEHQSTWNPNMPLRDLLYISRLLEKHVNAGSRSIYSSSLIRIPAPRFVVFYNGQRRVEDHTVLKLSDAFEKPETDPALELRVRLININPGASPELMERCRTLREYSEFVARIRKHIDEEASVREAVEQAADEALEQKCRVLLCMDDVICSWLLRKLQREHLQIPRDVRVASFYNSWVLENTDPAITAIAFDARELGEAACRKLFCLMEQEEAPERTLLPYQILLREST